MRRRRAQRSTGARRSRRWSRSGAATAPRRARAGAAPSAARGLLPMEEPSSIVDEDSNRTTAVKRPSRPLPRRSRCGRRQRCRAAASQRRLDDGHRVRGGAHAAAEARAAPSGAWPPDPLAPPGSRPATPVPAAAEASHRRSRPCRAPMQGRAGTRPRPPGARRSRPIAAATPGGRLRLASRTSPRSSCSPRRTAWPWRRCASVRRRRPRRRWRCARRAWRSSRARPRPSPPKRCASSRTAGLELAGAATRKRRWRWRRRYAAASDSSPAERRPVGRAQRHPGDAQRGRRFRAPWAADVGGVGPAQQMLPDPAHPDSVRSPGRCAPCRTRAWPSRSSPRSTRTDVPRAAQAGDPGHAQAGGHRPLRWRSSSPSSSLWVRGRFASRTGSPLSFPCPFAVRDRIGFDEGAEPALIRALRRPRSVRP